MHFFGSIASLLFVNQQRFPVRTTSCYMSTSVDQKVDFRRNDALINVERLSGSREMVNLAKGTYDDLGKGDVSIKASSTIEFKFVNPPSKTESFSWSCDNPEKLNLHEDMGKENIFETVASSYGREKPVAVYLPGLDGTGISATQQFDDLAETFELWRMTVDQREDRSSFLELTNAVVNFINDLSKVGKDREVYIIGESFGGLLAPSVALRLQGQGERTMSKNLISGMVLVNPATSFDETQWSTFGPLLASLRYFENDDQNNLNLPTPYSVMGGIALSAVIPDSTQYGQILDQILKTPVRTVDDLRDTLASIRDGFGILAEALPAEVVEHRVSQWLPVGTSIVNRRLSGLNVPTLVIAGEDDNMLPTKKEAERLIDVMPNCTSIFVKDAGHFVLDNRFNLTDAIIHSDLDPIGKVGHSKKYDPILDWKLPEESIRKAVVARQVEPLRTLTSPVFYSTNAKSGLRTIGLGQIPREGSGPTLFVANHQLLGLDLGMIISQLIEERGISARGLAHPIIFQGGDAFGAPTGQNEIRDKNGKRKQLGTFETFGAVMVSPKNYYRLMQTGQNALLFPGGVREVFHGKDEAYELFWPEKVDFVRIAAKFNATIVTISAVGAADSANILIDAPDILNLPFGLGERAMNNTQNTVSARFDQDKDGELFQPPLVVPKPLPARQYFVFGRPIETKDVNYSDKEQCETLYSAVKMELRKGLDDVLEARKKDPFADTARRLAYERLTGKKAPSFQVEELNKN